jgi:hypothetical protein
MGLAAQLHMLKGGSLREYQIQVNICVVAGFLVTAQSTLVCTSWCFDESAQTACILTPPVLAVA